MQKTTFPIEILVHDDASTDHSADIIREYTVQYPDLFKPIYQTENQYSKGVKVSATFQFPRAKGKYIALCEGDDYWTDPYKLQKQVDFLESHPEYVMCSHVCDKYLQNSGVKEENSNAEWANKSYSLNDLVHGEWPFQTATIVFTRKALDLKYFCSFRITMDIVLFYLLLKQGLGYSLADNMSVYRVHQGGSWSGLPSMTQWKSFIEVRLSIYAKENTDAAAQLIRSILNVPIGRAFYLINFQMMMRVLSIVKPHFGWGAVVWWFFNRVTVL